jgi:hypothetical protein
MVRRAPVVSSPSGLARWCLRLRPKTLIIATSVFFVTTASSIQAQQPSACPEPTATAAVDRFAQWKSLVEERHPDRLLRLYAEAAQLETPFLPEATADRAKQRAFWVEFLARNPRIELLQRTVSGNCVEAIELGTYRLTARTHHRASTEATYTIAFKHTYRLVAGQWALAQDSAKRQAAPGEAALLMVGQPYTAPAVAGFVQRAAPAAAAVTIILPKTTPVARPSPPAPTRQQAQPARARPTPSAAMAPARPSTASDLFKNNW